MKHLFCIVLLLALATTVAMAQASKVEAVSTGETVIKVTYKIVEEDGKVTVIDPLLLREQQAAVKDLSPMASSTTIPIIRVPYNAIAVVSVAMNNIFGSFTHQCGDPVPDGFVYSSIGTQINIKHVKPPSQQGHMGVIGTAATPIFWSMLNGNPFCSAATAHRSVVDDFYAALYTFPSEQSDEYYWYSTGYYSLECVMGEKTTPYYKWSNVNFANQAFGVGWSDIGIGRGICLHNINSRLDGREDDQYWPWRRCFSKSIPIPYDQRVILRFTAN